ncbi:MAG: 30S ribosomal protein S2 [Elusimicrobia bacterium]|nr:30S ribosomal protein S2 [Elusimicrobiota bacterium]
MVNISMKAMLEAGVHFGHQTRRWNPKMGKYIFGERNNIHIIDLQKTVKELKKAYQFIKDQAALGMSFLFVGTKKQAQEIIKTEAERCGAAYVHNKWLGGCLTNFSTIRKSIGRLEELERWEKDGLFKVLSKKEVSRLTKEMNRLKKLLTGIRPLKNLPQIVFVVDPMEEEGTVKEARKLKIPIVAICDTNCDPDLISYPIPGNDDAARSIKLFCNIISEAVIEGKGPNQKTDKEPAPTSELTESMESTLPEEESNPDESSPDLPMSESKIDEAEESPHVS